MKKEYRGPKIMAEKPQQALSGAAKQGPLVNAKVPTQKPTAAPLASHTRGPRDK